MAIENGNNYIFETVRDSTEISTGKSEVYDQVELEKSFDK